MHRLKVGDYLIFIEVKRIIIIALLTPGEKPGIKRFQ